MIITGNYRETIVVSPPLHPLGVLSLARPPPVNVEEAPKVGGLEVYYTCYVNPVYYVAHSPPHGPPPCC